MRLLYMCLHELLPLHSKIIECKASEQLKQESCTTSSWTHAAFACSREDNTAGRVQPKEFPNHRSLCMTQKELARLIEQVR